MSPTELGSKGVTLRAFLRKRREQLGLSQADIARAVGLTSGDFISLIEIGQRRLSLDRVPRLARALGVDQYQLCMLALQEFHPALYRVMRGQRKEGEGEPLVLTVTDEASEKLRLLSPEVRRLVTDMIDTLYEKEHSGMRVAPSVEEGAAVA